MSRRLRTEMKGEAFPHRTLWTCAKSLFDRARSEPKGAKYPDMAACLMAYLAYEAYLNLLLSRLDPAIWENEREFFSKGEYRGTEGKLQWISEFCGGFSWNRGARPYQTIHKMGKLRDRMTHAKPFCYSSSTEHTEENEPNWWPRDAYDDVKPELVEVVIHDFDEFMEFVHERVKHLIDDPWLRAGALKGTGSYSMSSTTIAT
ncbi:hypothetical protein MYX82_12470 [Acidobacteria bacterium AH-259-D05]|nr:hypothetical protein [Acidobacteria bacterium AH-259-D05]